MQATLRHLIPSTGLLALAILVLSGCDNTPSNVGTGLLDPQVGQPATVTVDASIFENQSDPDITGGSGTIGASRALAGRVDDPALGIIESRGSIDFAPTMSKPAGFNNASISLAELTLDLDYVFGDTLSPLTLQVVDIAEAWQALGVSADTTLSIGDPVMELEIIPHPQILRFDLPEEWVQKNDIDLRSDNFLDSFNGFQFRAVSGNAIVGLHFQASTLKLAVPGDTAIFAMSKQLSSIEKSRIPLPEGNVLLQDGTDSRIEVGFDLNIDPLASAVVHRSLFQLSTDSPPIDTPTGFIRPGITKLNFAFVSGLPRVRLQVATADVSPDGRITFEDVLFNNILKSVLIGSIENAAFEISTPISEATLNVLFLADSLSVSPPQALLTVTNIN